MSFVAALACVRWLLRFVSSHTFDGFAAYGIVFGLLILVGVQAGWVEWGPTE